MATLKITKKTTVANLKKQFSDEVGAFVLRVYDHVFGVDEAADDDALVSLGAEVGEVSFSTSRTVGEFERTLQQKLYVKVKVYTKDNKVKVLENITLAVAKTLPNDMTKEKMEEYMLGKCSEKDNEVPADEATDEVEIPEEYKDITSFVDIYNLEKYPWSDTSEAELDEQSDELEEYGVVVAYAFDEDDDFESSAWVGSVCDIFVDRLPDWADKWRARWHGEIRFDVYFSTDVKLYGGITNLDEDEWEQSYAILHGLLEFVSGSSDIDWDLGEHCMFRINWAEDNKYEIFEILADGSFDGPIDNDEKLVKNILKQINN